MSRAIASAFAIHSLSLLLAANAVASTQPGDKPLSEEGQEALGDLANLASARIEEVDPEQDEESLTEIEEYLRMAVLLLHADCAMGPRHRQRLH